MLRYAGRCPSGCRKFLLPHSTISVPFFRKARLSAPAVHYRTKRRSPMKRPSKTTPKQLQMSLYREHAQLIGETRREELLDALADLLLEALNGEVKENQTKEQKSDEPENHL
jgi:hypothetical protein